MDFQPTPEQQLIKQTVREFAEAEVRPIAAKMDATCKQVDHSGGLRPTGGGRCPPHITPRSGASRPRDPLVARADALAEVA